MPEQTVKYLKKKRKRKVTKHITKNVKKKYINQRKCQALQIFRPRFQAEIQWLKTGKTLKQLNEFLVIKN